MQSPLKISNLVKDYGTLRAVDHVNFAMQPGEVFGLLGPNGAGKTTLISIVVTLEQATSGQAFVFGHEVRPGAKAPKMLIGFVPQELIAYGYFDVEEILGFYSGFFGLWNNKARIRYLLDRLNLYEHRHKKVKQLSGGMKRRLLIAKALLHNPRLLLLDEPTAGVDIELRANLWDFVRELKSQGVSILLTTHYINEAEELCDRVGILQHGKLKTIGPTQQLVRQLTQREIILRTKPLPQALHHEQLVSQTPEQLVFRVPSSTHFGDILAQLKMDPSQIIDVQIREGTLEAALRQVLGDGL